MKQTIKRHLNKRKYTRNLRKLRKKYTRNMRKATRNLLKKSRRFMNKTYKIQRGGSRMTKATYIEAIAEIQELKKQKNLYIDEGKTVPPKLNATLRRLTKRTQAYENEEARKAEAYARENVRKEEDAVLTEIMEDEVAALNQSSQNKRSRRFGEREAVCELKKVGVNKLGRVLPDHPNDDDLRKQIVECLKSEKININSGK